MDKPRIYRDPEPSDRRTELELALAAWHGATLRLEQTHSALRSEVCRLADDLEIKNRELNLKSELAELGQVAAHVAHDVRDNLVPLALHVSQLKRRLAEDADGSDLVAKIETGLAALDGTVDDLLNFTVGHEPQLQWVNVRQVVDEVCASLATKLAAQDVETNTDVPPNLGAFVDRQMLRTSVLKLARNALDAMPNGGRLVITSYIGAGGLELEVADSGPGLNEEVRRRAFEPFFTTKNGATGLGLAIVHRIVDVHGGDIVAMNCPEGGAAFTLRFPQRTMRAAA